MPMLILAIVLIHIRHLHVTGSNNPLNIPTTKDIIRFHQTYTVKDGVGIFVVVIFIEVIIVMHT